jgi:hypothetical protein
MTGVTNVGMYQDRPCSPAKERSAMLLHGEKSYKQLSTMQQDCYPLF